MTDINRPFNKDEEDFMNKEVIGKFSDVTKDWAGKLPVKKGYNEEAKQLPKQTEESSGYFPSKKELNADLLDKNNFLGLSFNQILVIILILVIGVGIYCFYYFGENDYFRPILVDNSTCIAPNITIPSCPASPNYSCNCPSPNITVNFTMPSTLNITHFNLTA